MPRSRSRSRYLSAKVSVPQKGLDSNTAYDVSSESVHRCGLGAIPRINKEEKCRLGGQSMWQVTCSPRPPSSDTWICVCGHTREVAIVYVSSKSVREFWSHWCPYLVILITLTTGFYNNLRPNSIMLSGSKLVRSWSQTESNQLRTCLRPTSNLLRTSFEADNVMEFGFYTTLQAARTVV